MKDANDKSTVDLFSQKRLRGRPVTGCAKPDAERAKEYRKRKKQTQSSCATEEMKATQLLAQFMTELGDEDSVTPSEAWVASVRAFFHI